MNSFQTKGKKRVLFKVKRIRYSNNFSIQYDFRNANRDEV